MFFLLGILDDIFDFLKIEVGKFNIDNILFFVLDIVEEVVCVLLLVVKKWNFEFEFVIVFDIFINLIGDIVWVC